MRHASLFSGIGAPDLAAEWMGWKNVFHCEINPFGRKILNYYWPDSISYEDIKTTDFSIHRGTIDVLTGGFPCQPYSLAGQRKGKEDERHLWPEMLRAIREVQPRWVVGENVLGLVGWNGGMVFEEVQADLEAEGYKIQPYILPAAAVGAPHRRDRVWFVASLQRITSDTSSYGSFRDNELKESVNMDRDRISLHESDTFHGSGITPNSESNGNSRGLQLMEKKNGGQWKSKEHGKSDARTCDSSEEQYVANTSRERFQVSTCGEFGEVQFQEESFPRSQFGRAFTKSAGWENFPTQSPICNGDDGLSSRLDGITFSRWRTESIKAGGNAIVPQVIHQIFKAIQAYEDQL